MFGVLYTMFNLIKSVPGFFRKAEWNSSKEKHKINKYIYLDYNGHFREIETNKMASLTCLDGFPVFVDMKTGRTICNEVEEEFKIQLKNIESNIQRLKSEAIKNGKATFQYKIPYPRFEYDDKRLHKGKRMYPWSSLRSLYFVDGNQEEIYDLENINNIPIFQTKTFNTFLDIGNEDFNNISKYVNNRVILKNYHITYGICEYLCKKYKSDRYQWYAFQKIFRPYIDEYFSIMRSYNHSLYRLSNVLNNFVENNIIKDFFINDNYINIYMPDGYVIKEVSLYE